MSLISYHREIHRLFRFLVPEGAWVLELGYGRGDLLAVLKPGHGLGINRSEEAVATAREIHSGRENLEFVTGDIESFDWGNREPFDVIVAADLVTSLNDVQQTLAHLLPVCTPRTRLIFNFHSNLWRPIVDLPIRYRARTYGEVKIRRWRDGLRLARMCLAAYRRFKMS